MSSQNAEIKSTLVGIYEKLSKPNTKEVGYEQYKLLIQTYINVEKQITYILQQISDYIGGLSSKEKEIGLKLISLIFLTFSSPSKSYQLTPPILSILQSNITDSNIPILPAISTCFGEVVQYSMKNEIDMKEIDMFEQKIYELLQGFCIYNMKQNEKANKICGSLCLTKLVENCPLVLQPNYMKLIWENIIFLIDKKHFNAKYELLNCLISIILGAEGLFKPYANVTLYKVLDFLTDSDWLKRKLALNVVYTLILYCKEEILPLKEHIVEFLKGLKSDKVKEVREVCLLILQIFNEKGPNDKEEGTVSSSVVIKQRKKLKEKAKGRESEKEIEKDKKKEEQSYISVNTSLSGISGLQKKKSCDGKFSKVMIHSNSNKFDLINSKDIYIDNEKRALTPTRVSKNKIKNNFAGKNIQTGEEEVNDRRNRAGKNIQTGEEEVIDRRNRPGKNSQTAEEEVIDRKNRAVVNKKENSFVNEKMVIRRNPNYSIFKTGPNQDFFKQANNQPDIVVLDNKKTKINDREEQNSQEYIRNEESYDDKEKEDYDNNQGFNTDRKDNDRIETIDKDDIDIIQDNDYFGYDPSLKNKPEDKTTTQKQNDKNLKNVKNEQVKQVSNKSQNINMNVKSSYKKPSKMEYGNEDYNDEDNNDGHNKEKNKDDLDLNMNTFPNNITQNNQIDSSSSIKKNNSNSSRRINIHLNIDTTAKNKPKLSTKESNNKNNTIPEQPQNQGILTELLLQMKNLSEKQIFLIDSLSEMQQNTTSQIDSMTTKIRQLESNLNSLSTQLTSIRASRNQPQQENSYCLKQFNSFGQKLDNWEEIQMNIQQNNIGQAFNLALPNESDLIKLINQVTLSQLREVLPSLLEDSVLRLLAILMKGQNITLIISYMKNILMGVKCDLRKTTKHKIKDGLIYLLNNSSNFPDLSDEDLVDINLVLSYLKCSN